MILPSPGGLRTSRLRSLKSLLVNSSSHETSATSHSSSEDEERSTTGAFLEPPPPYSNTSEQGRHEEISDGDPGDGGYPDNADGGVLVSLGDGLPSLKRERERLVPLLSFIIG
jgi:hypothetical protein